MKPLTILALAALLTVAPGAAAQFVEPDVEVLYSIDGENPGDNFGILPAAIGDLDGDGVLEFLVTAPGNDDLANDAGKAYLFDGATGALIRAHAGSVAGVKIQRAAAVGDVDGDGIPDYGYSAWPDGGTAHPGYVKIHSGATGDLLYEFTGENDGDAFGFGLSYVRDLNADGHDEFLIGAPFHDDTDVDQGRVYLHSGADGTLLRMQDGPAAQAQFGHAIGGIGDLDGDGFDEYVVGSPEGNGPVPGHGSAYVFSGATGAEIPPAMTGHAQRGAIFGGWIQVSRIDVNGDGFADIPVSDQGDSRWGPETGRFRIFDGTNHERIWVRVGASALQGLGANGNVFDVDGDGLDDVVVTSWRSPDGGFPVTGKAEICKGTDGTLLRTITATDSAGCFGGYAFGLGDVDGDGPPDYFINAPCSNAVAPTQGRIWVIRGRDHTPTGSPVATSPAGGMLLASVRPNPSTDVVYLRLAVPRRTEVSVRVVDVRGRHVATVHEGPVRGDVTLSWPTADDGGLAVPAGVYFVEARAGGRSETRKVVVAR
jgi:FG-GAP repeat